jgi:hypothetical protein
MNRKAMSVIINIRVVYKNENTQLNIVLMLVRISNLINILIKTKITIFYFVILLEVFLVT